MSKDTESGISKFMLTVYAVCTDGSIKQTYQAEMKTRNLAAWDAWVVNHYKLWTIMKVQGSWSWESWAKIAAQEVGFGQSTAPEVNLSWDTLPRSMSGLQPVNQAAAAPLEGSKKCPDEWLQYWQYSAWFNSLSCAILCLCQSWSARRQVWVCSCLRVWISSLRARFRQRHRKISPGCQPKKKPKSCDP